MIKGMMPSAKARWIWAARFQSPISGSNHAPIIAKIDAITKITITMNCAFVRNRCNHSAAIAGK
jgi:hypothetical protein